MNVKSRKRWALERPLRSGASRTRLLFVVATLLNQCPPHLHLVLYVQGVLYNLFFLSLSLSFTYRLFKIRCLLWTFPYYYFFVSSSSSSFSVSPLEFPRLTRREYSIVNFVVKSTPDPSQVERSKESLKHVRRTHDTDNGYRWQFA